MFASLATVNEFTKSFDLTQNASEKVGNYDYALYIIPETDADGNALDVKYQNQLEAYKKAFEKITGEKVKDAGIYHIT